jgi:hypothetical protein
MRLQNTSMHCRGFVAVCKIADNEVLLPGVQSCVQSDLCIGPQPCKASVPLANLAAIGSTPSRSWWRQSAARLRASLSPTSVTEPSPMHRIAPRNRYRNTQLFEPPREIWSAKPPPSPYRPRLFARPTANAESFILAVLAMTAFRWSAHGLAHSLTHTAGQRLPEIERNTLSQKIAINHCKIKPFGRFEIF